MSGLEAIAGIAELAGAGISAAGTLAGGDAQGQASTALAAYERQSGRMQQLAAQQAANEARAVAGAAGYQQTIEKRLVASRAQAIAASSGGGASDTTVQNLQAGIENLGSYNKLAKLYEGENRARGLAYEGNLAAIEGQNRGALEEYSGQIARRQARQKALETIVGGGTDIFSKYGKYLPKIG